MLQLERATQEELQVMVLLLQELKKDCIVAGDDAELGEDTVSITEGQVLVNDKAEGLIITISSLLKIARQRLHQQSRKVAYCDIVEAISKEVHKRQLKPIAENNIGR